MLFDYRRIRSTSSSTTPVTLLELATNISTDWMPGTPNGLSRGFVDLLSNVLQPETISRNRMWTLKQEVGKFEKQWKQVTSWILGVAFCRKVVEMEGYRWWAPVSAFTPIDRSWTPSTTNWYPSLPHHHCRITKLRPRLKRLMPDYVLARTNSTGGYEISFAESKGTNLCLENKGRSPRPWRKQSRNARFYFRNRRIYASQHMVVATRVNPKAKLSKTRRVYVRAWNSKNKDNQAPMDAIRDIILMHYFGVCSRIGMDANAKLLALSTYYLSPQSPKFMWKKYAEPLDKARPKLSEMAKEEISEKKIGRHQKISFFIASPRSDFITGERTIRLGLSEPAMMLVNQLQEGVENSQFEEIIGPFQEKIRSLSRSIIKMPNIRLRNDGVLTELFE